MRSQIFGIFVKIVMPDDLDITLMKGKKSRPAARFNRKGQDALYLSRDEESARVAIGQYVTEDTRQRLLLTFSVSQCSLLDLRSDEARDICLLASQSWLNALRRGEEPSSWIAADKIRSLGYDGLIDPSRRRPGLWHITLFRWNDENGPQVTRLGEPKPITLDLGYR